MFRGSSYDVLESFIIFYRTDLEILGVGVWKFGGWKSVRGGGRGVGRAKNVKFWKIFEIF